MLEFLAGFLTCAVLCGLYYVMLQYNEYLKNEEAVSDSKLKAENSVRHKGRSALRTSRWMPLGQKDW